MKVQETQDYKVNLSTVGGRGVHWLQLEANCEVAVCHVLIGKKYNGDGGAYIARVDHENVVRRGTAMEIALKRKIRFDTDVRTSLESLIKEGLILETYNPIVIDCVMFLFFRAQELAEQFDLDLGAMPIGVGGHHFNYRLPIPMRTIVEQNGDFDKAIGLLNELVPIPPAYQGAEIYDA